MAFPRQTGWALLVLLWTACGDDPQVCEPCEEKRDEQGAACSPQLDECNAASPVLTHLAECVEAFGACWGGARRTAALCWEGCGRKNSATKERCQADCSEALGRCRGEVYREENRCRTEDCALSDQSCQDACKAASDSRFGSCYDVDLLACTEACG